MAFLSYVPVAIVSVILLWAYIEHVQILVYLASRQLYLRAILTALLTHWLWLSATFSLAMIFKRGPGYSSNASPDTEKALGHQEHESPLLPSESVETSIQEEDDMPLDRLASQISPYVGLMSKQQEQEIVKEAEDGNLTVKANGQKRFCRKCNMSKPDRTVSRLNVLLQNSQASSLS